MSLSEGSPEEMTLGDPDGLHTQRQEAEEQTRTRREAQ